MEEVSINLDDLEIGNESGTLRFLRFYSRKTFIGLFVCLISKILFHNFIINQ